MKCPVCGKEIQRMYGHLLKLKDTEHQKLYNEQMLIVLDLFNEVNFQNTTIQDYDILFPYSSCLKIWQQFYGKEKCKQRANKLNGKNVSKTLKGRPLSESHKKALSESHKGQIPWNIGLNVNNSEKIRKAQDKRNKTMSRVLKEKYEKGEMKAWLKDQSKATNLELKEMYEKVSKTMSSKPQLNSRGISGFRKDIGHHAASTYEANIYRILQYHNSNYLKEFDIIKEIKYPNGDIKNYRIDILDIDGVFGIKNVYIEVKGFLTDRDRMKIDLFREQYPKDNLLLIGCGDRRDEYFWEPDIDYIELEKKYKPLIPLWEDKKQNLKTHPYLYKETD